MNYSFSTLLDILVKFGGIAILLVYLVFAIVVVRQIGLMVQTFNTVHEKKIRMLGWFHLGISIIVLMLAIIL